MVDDIVLGEKYRKEVLLLNEEKVLIANIGQSVASKDRYTIINCNGIGRVRVFRDYTLYLEQAIYPSRPLRPNFRGHPPVPILYTQVFQLAACNWRCWYCFVDDRQLSAHKRVSVFVSADELFSLYDLEEVRPDIVDLSGGQPDLVPEWTLWMVQAAERRKGLEHLYFWIDDNLSNDFVFRYLTPVQIGYLATHPRLSRMGCFKGFDQESFAFTTRAPASRFNTQFEIARRLINAGFQFFAYVTFTCENTANIDLKMRVFVDKLQAVREELPLRTTPLAIKAFAAARSRLTPSRQRSLINQNIAFQAWENELVRRFTTSERSKRPDEISMP